MSHRVLVNAEVGCVFTWLYDVVTDDDLAGVIADIRNSRDFHTNFDELADLSLASSFKVTTSAVTETGHECRSLFSASARRAIVAPTDVAYGVARMFQVYAEHEAFSVSVFRTIAEACSWLRLAQRSRLVEFPGQPRSDEGAGHSSAISISGTLQNVTTELRKAQNVLTKQEGDIDPRILTDFRDALNRVRNTAWAVEQYLQSKATESESQTVLSIVSGERVRVTYQLCKLVTADLANHEIPFQKGQLIQLRDATHELGTHLDKAVGE